MPFRLPFGAFNLFVEWYDAGSIFAVNAIKVVDREPEKVHTGNYANQNHGVEKSNGQIT